MSVPEAFKINLEEEFPHLDKAPIVEAVIDIRAQAQADWQEAEARAKLESRLPDYPVIESHREFSHKLKLEPGRLPKPETKDLGWRGLIFKSEDGKHIAQFNRDGFIFSRLEPYGCWDSFMREARKLWDIHLSFAQPVGISRLGLRFINRIVVPLNGLVLGDYLESSPAPPKGLNVPFSDYFSKETLAIPGHNYAINRTRSIQRLTAPHQSRVGLIVDIDVFTPPPFLLDVDKLNRSLTAMRWLKNKTFFGSLTNRAIESLK